VDQVATGNGWTMWKAIDETLARPVSILTFVQGFPRIPQVVTAARAASRLTDPRMAQVFDVEDGGAQAYIVLEWVGGDSLTGLLDNGPLDPILACSLIGDAARAVAGAHALGQAHLRLTPDTLWWTRGSGIKITGLGIDAALAGDGLTAAAAYDPSVADTIAVAGLLYAALTGYWPGEEPTSLPAAPASDGAVATPRQVSADVSSALDSVITRALLQRPTRQGPPIQSPAEFADELAKVAPPVPLPEPAPPAPAGYQGYGGGYRPDPNDPDSWAVQERGPSGTAPYQPPSSAYPGSGYGGNQYTGAQRSAAGYAGRQRGGTSRVLIAIVIVLVLVVAGVAVWALGFRNSSAPTAATGSQPPSSSAAAAGPVLKPVTATTFNILGSDNEDGPDAGKAIDGSAATFWHTDSYQKYPDFGNLKAGTGLLIDMGKPVKLSQVQVTVGNLGTTTAEIYVGNSAAMSKTALSNFTLVGQKSTGKGTLTYKLSNNATGRYVLVWLTGNLPANPDSPGQYQGRIYNVALRGSNTS
jgi:serine/threonine protein kinase